MQYTETELMDLPMNLLTNIDIRSKEEEELVQRVLNARKVEENIIDTPLVLPSSATDNMTIEKERELQAKIDAHNESIRKSLEMREDIGTDTDTELEPVPEPMEPLGIDTEPVPEPSPLAHETVEPSVPVVESIDPAIKCTLCGSRGFRHRKGCSLA